MSLHRYCQKNIKGEVKLYLQKMFVKTTYDKLENIKAKKNSFSCEVNHTNKARIHFSKRWWSCFLSFNKINYSWNRRGMTLNRSTTPFSESISIVSSILSNGISITVVRIGNIKTNTFIEYIEHLIYVWMRLGLNTNQICLFMDNSPVHWTKKVKEFLRENELTCIFLLVCARHGTCWNAYRLTEENGMRQKE